MAESDLQLLSLSWQKASFAECLTNWLGSEPRLGPAYWCTMRSCLVEFVWDYELEHWGFRMERIFLSPGQASANWEAAFGPSNYKRPINSNRGIYSTGSRTKIRFESSKQVLGWHTDQVVSHSSVNVGSNDAFGFRCSYPCSGNLSFAMESPKKCCKRCQMKK